MQQNNTFDLIKKNFIECSPKVANLEYFIKFVIKTRFKLQYQDLAKLVILILIKKEQIFRQFNIVKYTGLFIDSIINYFKKKLHCENIIDEQKINKQDEKLKIQKVINHEIFKQYLETTCICCKNALMKNFPYKQRVITLNQNKLYLQQLRISICAIANSQNTYGSILVAQQFNQKNCITKGIKKFTQNQINSLKNNIHQALKTINFGQEIKVTAQSLPLFNDDIGNKLNNQYIIRINVSSKYSVNPSRYQKRLFYIQHRIKKQYKPLYIFVKLEKDGASDVQIVKSLNSEQIYEQIIKNFYKDIQNLHRFPIIQNCQLFNTNNQKIHINIKPIQTQFKKTQYEISNDPNQFIFGCCKIFMDENFERQIPQIKQNQSIAILSINQKFEVLGIISKIQKLFKSTKTRYTFIIPCYELQNSLNKLRKRQNPTIITYLICFFVFQGKYNNFKQNFNKLYKITFNQALTIGPITQKISLAMMLQGKELDWYNQLIFQKYTVLPLTKKIATMKQNVQIYKQIQFKFDKIDRDAALYTYLFFEFIRKRPLCII